MSTGPADVTDNAVRFTADVVVDGRFLQGDRRRRAETCKRGPHKKSQLPKFQTETLPDFWAYALI